MNSHDPKHSHIIAQLHDIHHNEGHSEAFDAAYQEHIAYVQHNADTVPYLRAAKEYDLV